MLLKNWQGWDFYQPYINGIIPDDIFTLIKNNSIESILSSHLSKTIDVFISRIDKGIQLSLCIRINTSLIVWVYWKRSQGILRHRLSLQYQTPTGNFVHFSDLTNFQKWPTILVKIFSIFPGYKNNTNPYSSLYKFIITENVPLEWKKIKGLLNSLSKNSHQDSIYPTRVSLELCQSGNRRTYRGTKIDKTYFYGF